MHLRALLCGLALACLAAAPSPGSADKKESFITVTGTVTFVELEGGFYGIIADSGERYFPLNLDQQYKVDKLKVRVAGYIRKKVMTTTMWGTPLEIIKIRRL